MKFFCRNGECTINLSRINWLNEKNVNDNEEYSDEVREIMDQQANWMVRWGAALLVLIVTVVVGALSLITHPVFVTVPITMEAATSEASFSGVAGEAVVSKSVYDQVRVGQEVRVTALAAVDPEVIGRVDGKLSRRRVRIVFPIEAGQQRKLRTALEATGNVKIKTGENRLISQFIGLFLPK